MARHIRTGDAVIVTTGVAKGQTGVIKEVLTKSDRVIIEGVNLRVTHQKATQANPKGQRIEREASIHMSNVNPVVDGKPTRVRFETKTDGSKVRLAVRNGKVLSVLRGPKKK